MRKKKQFPLAATPNECRDPSLRCATPGMASTNRIVVPVEPLVREVRHEVKTRRLPGPVVHSGTQRQQNVSLVTPRTRHNAGAKIAVVVTGLPTVIVSQSRDDLRDGRRAARMMMPQR